MKYAIQVNCGFTRSMLPVTACRFIETALEGGNEVIRVFFYHDGVWNGVACPQNPCAEDWSRLAERYRVELVLCVTACENRGLTGATTLLPGFCQGGLGLWTDACLRADRLLVFAD